MTIFEKQSLPYKKQLSVNYMKISIDNIPKMLTLYGVYRYFLITMTSSKNYVQIFGAMFSPVREHSDKLNDAKTEISIFSK